MTDKSEIAKSARSVSFFTFISRILGLVRDIVITYLFGAGQITDAFWVAFRIPNLLRRLFAEGTLTVSFIPVFTQRLEHGGKERAKAISDTIFMILVLLLILISLIGIIFSPYIVKLFASGFSEEVFELAVKLNRIMFPYILFISLTALSMGILNSLKHFFAPAFSPVLFNICIILFALILHDRFDVPITSLAIGVIAGGVLQFLFQIPFLKNRNFLFSPKLLLSNPDVRRIFTLIIPQVFGLAVYNLNIIVNTQYASYLPEGTVSYLFLSERLIEFPLGIIAVSLATVLLPNFSSYIAKGDLNKFRETYVSSVKILFYILLPACIGLIALSKPICNILYQRGEFGYEQMVFTSQCLLGYAIGMWAVGLIRITVPAFFAQKDTKTPVLVAFMAFILNALLGYILSFKLELNHLGLALASSASSLLNISLLIYLINKKIAKIEITGLLTYMFKIVAIGSIMGISVYKISHFTDWSQSGFEFTKVMALGVCVVAGLIVYSILSK
ncbi:MAG: murein biosynthesis integral membrane protein MurJ, partial [Candidatus Dadabacteria bacterium]|nr:murein biosynthesis integral membrane protein MurJ [Candidatus Dadabacteria bacterium]NIS08219.1 murein biosynthesis integral membrane protein MurJ [Candidatus Dadabacteria bacterium]NIV41486.1 murein biosynthesis integral membrane protein MurJ [Candidatus Dadabacteria bacterium]NIY21707.1 murein biosynthesis integral membrane protein MurJ [Candidatus Dadabacteria bacterium]